MRRRLHRARPDAGFTLLELGIVLGVAAILAAAIAPDFIESMRNKMAEKAAVDVAMVHDAARWFFLESGRAGGDYRWPGENGVNQCRTNFTNARAISDFLMNGYLAGGGPANPYTPPKDFLMNPWGEGYEFDLYEPPPTGTGMRPGCLFGIVTTVPIAVSEALISFLPQAACGTACPGAAAVPAGMTRCCSYVPKPGFEVWKDLCPAGTQMRLDGSTVKCLP